MGEVAAALNDPNFALQLAVGPPFPDLVPQRPGSGLHLAGLFTSTPTRFVFKKAHMSAEDFRIFSGDNGRVVASMWHFGKNPYEAFDPLGQSGFVQAHENRMGEWDSLCTISGWQGMPHLRVRPKALSRHGRQWVQSPDGSRTFFNISKESRLKEMSLRSNMLVCAGDGDEEVYKLISDMMGRTIQFVDAKTHQQVAFLQQTTKALILNAAIGAGSEMVLDVAPGVDWTAIVAIVLAMQQVGKHVVKDALGNWVLEPIKDSVVGGTLEATGLQGVASSGGSMLDSGLRFMQKAEQLSRMFK